MTGNWVVANKAVFVRDLVRDYCHVSAALHEQQQRFVISGTVSYAVVRDLLGEAMRKGVFWRLKDTAHYLFRAAHPDSPLTDDSISLWQFSSGKAPDGMVQQSAVEGALDWIIGYAFHECVKLKEDAFQHQHYANRLEQMQQYSLESVSKKTPFSQQIYDILPPLLPLTKQTQESTARELTRILQVLEYGRSLLITHLQQHSQNYHLARLLVAQEALVRSAFGPQFEALLAALYPEAEQRFLLAAHAYMEGGRYQEVLDLLEEASLDPTHAEVQRLREAAQQQII